MSIFCAFPNCNEIVEYENFAIINELYVPIRVTCNSCGKHREWALKQLKLREETDRPYSRDLLFKDFGTQAKILDHWSFEHYKKTIIAELKLERYGKEQDSKRSILWKRFDGVAPYYKFERWLNRFFKREVT